MAVDGPAEFSVVPQWHGSIGTMLCAQEGPKSELTQSQTQSHYDMANSRDDLVMRSKRPHPI